MTDSVLIPVPVFIGPEPQDWLREAVIAGGGVEVPLTAAQAVVWFGFPHNFPALPRTVRWVQLPFAGIESWMDAGLLDASRTWTNGAGVYADTVAEHALALLLMGVRGLHTAATIQSWDPTRVGPAIGTLRGAIIGVLGAGGIGRALILMLRALGAEAIAINRSGRAVRIEGQPAIETIPVELLDSALRRCDHLVLAAPGTAATRNLVGARQLGLLRPHSWIINVARGTLIDTEALTLALTEQRIGGAALDVTEPEPLPDGHPLWALPNVIITPHVANPPHGIATLLAARITENVVRFGAGRELLGVVDPQLGY
ncbi:D-isomer specific 2-hydroxyacid dehydrogenase family protein [Tomitella biformata]|uniref:D-isomer specific 2-hydroxyacid dehydrogenase family protein n=1 Tax=Tomitella biformata TaxID=630403 RepID=UPI000466DB57|nr:D-isomer specific 2-hydroxyacid dehydrogenase family protein [Tomitella biformata]